MLGVHKATLQAAGRDTGDTVRVTMAIDAEPLPNDEVPEILALALEKSCAGSQCVGVDASVAPATIRRVHHRSEA